jgi:hypothetical protein
MNTAYDKRAKKFTLSQEIIDSFGKIVYLGPTPIYEEYVTVANFPYDIDLHRYVNNTINIDIIEHLKHHHLDEIFPKQQTSYMHKINVNRDMFEATQKKVNKDVVNIAINAFDPVYDTEFSLQYDLIYCLDKIEAAVDKPIHIYIVGVIHPTKTGMVERTMTEALEPFNFTVHNFAGKSLTEQMAVLLNVDLLLSGSYSLGFLAYTAHVPTFIIYPFNLNFLKGKTTDPTRKTDWYIETTDEDVFGDVQKAVALITESNRDWNRNSHS